MKAHELVSLLIEYADPNAEVEIDTEDSVETVIGIDVFESVGSSGPAVWVTSVSPSNPGFDGHRTPADITAETPPWTPKESVK